MKISYCTTVFNRFWQLKKTLIHNLKKLKDDSNAEMILVNFSGDDSESITEFINHNCSWEILTGKLKYYIRKEPWIKFNVSIAKNRAYHFASGDILVNLDCDNYIQINDSIKIRRIFTQSTNPENIILHQTNGTSALKSKYLNSRYHLFDEKDLDYSKENVIYDGTFGRISIHRKMLFKTNGYNENLLGMGMEDIDLLIRGIKLGGEYIFKSQPEYSWKNNFIPQKNQNDEHNNNQKNWKLMDSFLEKKIYSPTYLITEQDNNYIKHLYSYDINYSKKYRLTLFSIIFKCDEFIDSFIQNIKNQEDVNKIFFIFFYFPNSVINKSKMDKYLYSLKKDFKNIQIFEIQYDIGLYNSWNEMIKLTKTEYIGNFNPDDLRKNTFCKTMIKWIKLNPTADLITGTYIPVYKIYSSFDEGCKENKEVWFNGQSYINNNGDIIHYKFKNINREFKIENMFQLIYNGGKKQFNVKTFCIPNSAPIWKRRLHDKFGYFREDLYGCYTDFLFWLVCLKGGAKMIQYNEPLSLFYISNHQAHRKLENKNSKTILDKIITDFGNQFLQNIYFSPESDQSSNLLKSCDK